MTSLVVHQCPKCELRFSFRSELEYHLNVDHPAAAPTRDSAENVDALPTPDAPPTPAPVGDLVAPTRRVGSPWKRLVGAMALVVSVVYAAVAVSSVSTAVVITVLLLGAAAAYVRRARGRARIPRR